MKLFLSEIQKQLDLVNEKIRDLEENAYKGAMSPRFLKADLPRARELLARRKVLEERIINYDP